jgi:hypothetical protein
MVRQEPKNTSKPMSITMPEAEFKLLSWSNSFGRTTEEYEPMTIKNPHRVNRISLSPIINLTTSLKEWGGGGVLKIPKSELLYIPNLRRFSQ